MQFLRGVPDPVWELTAQSVPAPARVPQGPLLFPVVPPAMFPAPVPFVLPNSSQSLTPSHGPVALHPSTPVLRDTLSLTWLALRTRLQKCFTQSFCFPLKRLSILLKYFCTAQDLQARKHVLIILLKTFSLFYLLLFTYGLQQSTLPSYSSELLYFSS